MKAMRAAWRFVPSRMRVSLGRQNCYQRQALARTHAWLICARRRVDADAVRTQDTPRPCKSNWGFKHQARLINDDESKQASQHDEPCAKAWCKSCKYSCSEYATGKMHAEMSENASRPREKADRKLKQHRVKRVVVVRLRFGDVLVVACAEFWREAARWVIAFAA